MHKTTLRRSHQAGARAPRRLGRVLAATVVATLGVTLAANPVTAAGQDRLSDDFSRTVASGWGTAPTGQQWTVGYGTHSVANGRALQSVAKGKSAVVRESGYSSTATDLVTSVSLDQAPKGGTAYLSVIAREVGSTDYRARVKVNADGSVVLNLSLGESALTSTTVPGITYTAGTELMVRVQAEGTSPTTLRAKAWVAGTAEPVDWQVTTTDATPALQTAGGIAFHSYLGSGATTSPLSVRWNDVTAQPIRVNVAPTAAFSASTSVLTANVNAGASADSDGTIASYAWNFGAGAGSTATGKTASYTYATSGTYTVTLTVTDDEGASSTTTKQVTVDARAFTPGQVKPSAATTGVIPGTPLTVHRGDITVTQPGTVIENMDIYGFVTVKAADVTIRNSRVRGSGPGTFNTGLINANHKSVRNLVIEDVTLVPDHPSVWLNGVLGHDYTARRVNTWNVVDGFGIYNTNGTTANVRIESSYVHDLSYFSPDPNHSDNQTHNDAIQIQGGSNIQIVGNYLSAYRSKTAGTQNYSYPQAGFGIIVTPNVNAVTNALVDRNWFDGGSIPLKIERRDKVGAMNFGTITNNRFARDMRNVYMAGKSNYFTILMTPSTTAVTSGNVYDDDGSAVTVRRDGGTSTAP